MAFCPLSLIWPQPAVLAVGRGFPYALGCKAFLCGPTEGAVKKPHKVQIYILELCFGLLLMPLPLHTAVGMGAGPLGEACPAVMLLLGRYECPPACPGWPGSPGTQLLAGKGPQKKGPGKTPMVTAARWRRWSQTHQRCSVKGGNQRTGVARREIEALFPDPG